MFILDSLMISGIRWALETTLTAAEAEMNDDTALREQLLEAEMRREMGEITDAEFADVEADLLARIREIKERRDGGAGPLAFGGPEPIESTADGRLQIEATVSGDFHANPADAPHTTVVERTPVDAHLLTATESGETVRVMDMEPGDANPPVRARSAARPAPRPAPARRASGRRRRGTAVRRSR